MTLDHFVGLDALEWQQISSGTNEAQTFYITTPDGIIGLIQLAYSTLNSWSPAVQMTARVYHPDGTKHVHSSNLSGSSLVVSQDKKSATCDSFSIQLLPNTEAPTYKVTYKSNEILADFTFEGLSHAIKGKEEIKHFTSSDPSAGFVSSRYIPRGKITGTIILKGSIKEIDGHGFFTHCIQNQPQAVGRWNLLNFQSEKGSLFLHGMILPPDYDYDTEKHSWGSLYLGDQLEAVLTDNDTHFGETEVDEFSGYPIPKTVKHVWSGKNVRGEPIEIEMNLKLDRLMDKIDVLADLPYLLRVFIQTLISAPFLYHWSEEVTVVVKKGSEQIEMSGIAFHETAFLNPLPEHL